MLFNQFLLLAAAAAVSAAPFPQGTETNPAAGLGVGIANAALSAPSLINAIPAVFSDLAQLVPAAQKIQSAIADGTIQGTNIPVAVKKLYAAARPTAAPSSIPQARSIVSSQYGLSDNAATTPPSQKVEQNFLVDALSLFFQGITSSDLSTIMAGQSTASNSHSNNNPALTASQFAARARAATRAGDAPFDIPEPALRAAMYIPPGFPHGAKQPVLMAPGTGATGGINFQSNIGKLLSSSGMGDPVYLNIPNNLLDDIQTNAEYVAYALQYLHQVTGKQVAIVTWSQGSLDAQWAYKYFPSTRSIVSDHVAVSPDYHGTVLAYTLCSGVSATDNLACVPSVLQQQYNSNLVTTLRANGGDAAYVPTTTIYSATDEIVQPQQGNAASGFLPASSKAQTSNTYLQGACAGLSAGAVYSHEGVLYNPVTWALVQDALKHDGPGDFNRVSAACQDVVAPGLSLADVLQTESLIPIAVYNIFSYLPKSHAEPSTKSYAV